MADLGSANTSPHVACGRGGNAPMTQGSTERVRGPGHLGNAGWSTAEYVFYPLLMLAATPVYVALLGVTDYGLWMLVLAITGFGTAANLGMGTATIKFVAACRGRGDADRVAATVRQTLSIAILGGHRSHWCFACCHRG